MDLQSIVRAFRYGQMQDKADRDPSAKRPPTIKFLGVFLAFALLAGGAVALWQAADSPTGQGGGKFSESTNSADLTSTPTSAPTGDPDASGPAPSEAANNGSS